MQLSDYKALFRASPFPYLVMDLDLNIIGASETYLRSVKRTEEDIVGKYIFDAFPEDAGNPEATNMAEVKASIARSIAKGLPDTTPFLRYSVPVDTPEGRIFEERHWSTVHTPVLGLDGAPLFVIQIAIDVSDLYRFDQKSERATLQLSYAGASNENQFNRAQMHEALSRILNNEREHLRSLFNQSPGFVAVSMGLGHVFELANEAYYQLIGHRDIIGKAVWEALPEVVGQGFEALLDGVYKTGVRGPHAVCRLRCSGNPMGRLHSAMLIWCTSPTAIPKA